ncbi:MAG: hypothetical protein LBV71_02360 [Prevotella sp.]|jgi:hypothetical protein|nr:hypothetical protein [Prevotella sp.]
MELSNYGLPRKVKERMIREYLGGVKTARMLSEESGMSLNAINKMICRYKDKFLPTFDQKPIILPAMKEKSKTVSESDLMYEISELRRQLKESQLKIEGYEIMGDILEEQYGIDLLKKSAAKQSPDLENDTQE